ncbi:hypothetical protein HLB44_10635 [Aquincola sp. S2]|uniref:Outer membrane protein assembly factor BamE n=1 Tax=Pseudaquabacterium terrae TaxID=2732868 RepID=A0ABX2EFS7_9BURK|nr:hypothetical protein [Aquabacterium terrae]NRF67441.1 hypothetical protein [Aquabacterium terrae]
MHRLAIVTIATALLAACAVPFRAGQTETELRAAAGAPTGRYTMPGGTTRLEYATGPMGRMTWMVDLDAQGRVARWDQVLDEAHFAAIVDGMPRDELLRTIGRPGHRAGEWMNRETWSWRYPTNDCLWFRVTLTPEGRVLHGGGFMPDPMCDPPRSERD